MWQGVELILAVIVESLSALGFPDGDAREERWRREMVAKATAGRAPAPAVG